jgi:CheY-like chemotaxis protein
MEGQVSVAERIVLIDDDPDFCEYARIVLESASYEVLIASDAAEGLALIREYLPDLVITDVMMSYTLEGASITREIRSDPQLSSIPVLVITAIARTPNADVFPDGTEPAPDGFLTKPVPPDRLLQAVRNCLSDESACRLV